MGSCSEISLRSLDDTRRVAAALARSLPADAFLTLSGDLGAGKTTWVRALATAIGIDPAEVTSPTFGLVHEYVCPRPRTPWRLVHVDAYRLGGPYELDSIGWDDLLDGGGWIVVEWPERITPALPARRLELALVITGETSRRLVIRSGTGWEGGPADLLAELGGIASDESPGADAPS
jgi:tRNA threonylcarbamoyladenosine biosynthesis protein TsaE